MAEKEEARRERKPAEDQTPPAAAPNADPNVKHSRGGITTKHDASDLGVPMLPGDPSEPVGPEDALGEGPKRGDYSERLGYPESIPHQAVAIPDAEPGQPNEKIVAQGERASDQGRVPKGKKGGVDSGEGS